MKSKIIVACIAAALVITFLSCGLFGSGKEETTFSIEGQWLIDSIQHRGSDSANNIGQVAFLTMKDSLPVGITFNSDSTFSYLNVPDSTKGGYYLSEDRNNLFIKEDSAYAQFNFISKSDTAFVASTTDSVIYYFKRK